MTPINQNDSRGCVLFDGRRVHDVLWIPADIITSVWTSLCVLRFLRSSRGHLPAPSCCVILVYGFDFFCNFYFLSVTFQLINMEQLHNLLEGLCLQASYRWRNHCKITVTTATFCLLNDVVHDYSLCRCCVVNYIVLMLNLQCMDLLRWTLGENQNN